MASNTANDRVETFDLIIIGTGSGNSIPSPALSDLKIAIVDDGRWFGGTCLNAGCIPTKMFVRPADLARNVREAGRLGVSTAGVDLDWNAVRDRVFGRIDPISQGGEAYRDSGEPNISLVRETVRFTGTHEITTTSGRVLRASQIVIGGGSRPRELEVLPFGDTVFTSDDAMRLESLPGRIVVIGGGVVAAEFAAIYSGFGAEVTQINRSPLFRDLDRDIRATFTSAGSRNWTIRTGVEVAEATHGDAGWTLTLTDASTLEADAVLVAAGRRPNTDRLDTPAAGFDHHEDGRLQVDEYQRVLLGGQPVGGVYALGDISSPHQLKHVANQDARIVASNLVAERADAPLTANTLGPVPYTVFSAPEIAVFGATLDEAKAAGKDAIEVRQDYGGTAWGWALEDTESFCKLVVERGSGKLLGAHIIGPDAPILLQPLIQAASFGQSVKGLARGQYWPHPAATEIIENALLHAEEEIQK
ncbi:mycothione reductase [Gulosibacter molinativorax]|uniref:Mycothione reductase n=1 Tax=Gulosibacter molinativorax TaxID=256821 RepID=A0ABT7C5T2_9MICO|nr:mycothione reductase [Gulosibacter molinativorax]MDJ1370380.1 mycothione reductase [Gulosibacter molinativorax]QUY61293.1 Mycothione reductase [Gulosibacter molinativorax]